MPSPAQHAMECRSKLQALEPNVEFLMSLSLHESMNVETIVKARCAAITEAKSNPVGVTTNSSSGVVDCASYYRREGEGEEEREERDIVYQQL